MYIIDDELYHYGIHGQKWGLRRYQNKDGSLTEAGKVRYRGLGGKVRYANDMAKNAIKKHKQKKALAKARKTKEEKKKAAEKLAADKKEWSKSAALLEKHIDDFTADEYKAAVQKLRSLQEIRDMKLNDAQRIEKYARIGLGLYREVLGAYNLTESALKTADERRNKNNEEARAAEKHDWARETHDKEMGRPIEGVGDGDNNGNGNNDGNTKKDPDNGNSDKGSDSNKKSSNAESSSSSASSEKSSSKPSFYSKVKEKASSVASSAKESLKETAKTATNSAKEIAKSAANSANEVSRAQAESQNQAFSSNKQSVSSGAKTAGVMANFAGVAAEAYSKTAVSKVSDAAKWYGSTAKDIVSGSENTKVNDAFNSIEEWTKKTLGN